MWCLDPITIILLIAGIIGVTWLFVAAYFLLRYRSAIAMHRHFDRGLHEHTDQH